MNRRIILFNKIALWWFFLLFLLTIAEFLVTAMDDSPAFITYGCISVMSFIFLEVILKYDTEFRRNGKPRSLSSAWYFKKLAYAAAMICILMLMILYPNDRTAYIILVLLFNITGIITGVLWFVRPLERR